MRIRAIAPVLALAALVGLGGAGCSKQLQKITSINEPPTVRLTYAPIDTTHEEFYVYRLFWIGYDPDGRVDHFEYVVDPPTDVNATVQWQSTTRNDSTFTFSAKKPEGLNLPQPRSQGFHVFKIRAVDNQGAVSEPVARAFYSFGVAPIVHVDDPLPNRLLSPVVTPAVRITYSGKDFIDPNGYVFEKPVEYRYKLFPKPADLTLWNQWLSNPDSLRLKEAPDFVGWTRDTALVGQVQFTNLTPSSEYLFVVVAIGRSGAYSPIWDLNSNMLKFFVGFAADLGPKITLFNSFFSYTYTGGFPSPLDPSWAIKLQVPAGQPLAFNWTAEAPKGSIMTGYRWALDLVSLDDETARSSQQDWYHWSSWNLNETAATVGPFAGAGGDTGEVHNFFMEAKDINGLVSLGWVQFRVFRPTFSKDLLIVDDTRFNVDQILQGRPDSLQPPSGAWPTRAELDTFLFAVGGVRWKMTPQGRLSPPGIFKGYSYDTLGTRYGLEDPTTPLGLLGQYRHVVWMTDLKGSLNTDGSTSPLPSTALLYMSSPNRQNTLATWVSQGGQLWALGDGFGNATNAPWNNVANDVNSTRCYRFDGNRPDLTPGRFMFDLTHWRSEFRVLGPVNVRFARYDQPDPTVGFPRPKTYWKGQAFRNPAYTVLPKTLQPRDPSTDPVWPLRTVGDFYVGNQIYSAIGVNLEYISLENRITETVPVPSHPDSSVEISTLDSLYLAYGSSYAGQMNQSANGEGVNVVMTYYHDGLENAPLVFSGTSIWDFRRQDCLALVDFVLGTLWGLPKNVLYQAPRAVAARAVAPRAAAPSPARGAVVSPPWTPPQPHVPAGWPVGTSTFQRRR